MSERIARGMAWRKFLCVVGFVLFSGASSVCGAKEATMPRPGFDAMEKVESLPLLPGSGTQTRQFISYDPSGGNDDGQFVKTCTRYIDSNGDHVIFDEYGPGCLYRQQMNLWMSPLDPTRMRIRYYFDDEKKPRIDMTIDQFWGRKGYTEPFTPPLSYFDDLPKNPHYNYFDRMGVCYYPLSFRKRLRVTLSQAIPKDGEKRRDYSKCWYQYTYILYPADTPVATWKGPEEDATAVRAQWNNPGKDPKPADGNMSITKAISLRKGQRAEVLNLKGEGSITSIRFTIKPYNYETLYKTVIRIFWDDQNEPAVDLPLVYLFGGGGALSKANKQVWDLDFSTLLYGYSKTKGVLYSYWPMPYWKSARIIVENGSNSDIEELTCDVTYKPSSVLRYSRNRTGYFHAKRTLDLQKSNSGLFTKAFVEEGYGKVVGLTFFTKDWSCDGDEFTFIDGSGTPQIHGDGSEDDHNAAWGGDRYYKQLWGSFTRHGDFRGIQQDYRIYMNDSYVFHRDIKITYECSPHRDRARTDCTVFYYKYNAEYCNLKETDCVDVGNKESETAHDYQIEGQTWQGTITSSYDGYEKMRNYHQVKDDGRSFTGASTFTVMIDPDNDGVRLRRRANRSANGLQLAKVYVDGVEVNERPWYLCDLSTAPQNQAWRDTDYDIPATYTKGKQNIRVRIEYVSAKDPKLGISEFFYRVFCFGLAPVPKPKKGA